jgi:very-short-patch-repair endonuclease
VSGLVRTAQARCLRKAATPAEKKLWSQLRNRQLNGYKFRRQQPVGDRILDFLCQEAKLAIELDGSGHQRHFRRTADLDKELELYECGVRVIRFDNAAVIHNLTGVLEEILRAIDPAQAL